MNGGLPVENTEASGKFYLDFPAKKPDLNGTKYGYQVDHQGGATAGGGSGGFCHP